MSTQDTIQPEGGGDLRVSLPRLHVLEAQMVKDVLFSRSCQELFLERTNAQREHQWRHQIAHVTHSNPKIPQLKFPAAGKVQMCARGPYASSSDPFIIFLSQLL